jgi:hypothetical protein
LNFVVFKTVNDGGDVIGSDQDKDNKL